MIQCSSVDYYYNHDIQRKKIQLIKSVICNITGYFAPNIATKIFRVNRS